MWLRTDIGEQNMFINRTINVFVFELYCLVGCVYTFYETMTRNGSVLFAQESAPRLLKGRNTKLKHPLFTILKNSANLSYISLCY